MIRDAHNSRRGNSLVEMVLLVPLYALIIAGAMFLGEIGMVTMQSHEVNEYAAIEPGDQSETAGLRDSGNLKSEFLTPYEGALSLQEHVIGRPPAPAEIEEIFDEMMKVQYWTSAHGSFTFRNGRMEYTISKQTHSRRMAEAAIVERYNLLSDNIAQLTSDTMQGYMERILVRTKYNFMPKYLTWSKFELEGAVIETKYQTARRDDLVREVDHAHGAPNAPIEALLPRLGASGGSLSDYPGFEPTRNFWEPN